MPPTSATAACAVLDLIAAAIGEEPIVGGGWGIDALLGRQTRDHGDLDVVVPAATDADVISALQSAGFRITTDWRPIRVALTHPDGAEVDVHPVSVGADGTRIQQGFPGVTYEYPPEDITDGSIDGRAVRCLSASLQMRFHDGYVPTGSDIADCRLLAAATGLPLPATIASADHD